MNTSVSSPTFISALCPGLENSFKGILPSLFNPTSTVTISFSIDIISLSNSVIVWNLSGGPISKSCVLVSPDIAFTDFFNK